MPDKAVYASTHFHIAHTTAGGYRTWLGDHQGRPSAPLTRCVKPVEIWSVNKYIRIRIRTAVIIPPPSVSGFERAESIKALGVTISRRFSVTEHVDNLLQSCAQTLFAMQTLRHHGLPTNALHAIFHATVVAKLSYASTAWWGYANADKARLEAFLRRSSKLGFRTDKVPTLASICADADDKLFRNVLFNDLHLLHHLLPPPPPPDNHYYLRSQTNHNLQLSLRISSLNDRNFFMQLLFKDMNYGNMASTH